ncbi:retrotransposon protein, putative, ty1-copia subclass [Tanacetum coccineum]
MDKVRRLLIQSGLPKTFWAEATCTAAYLINRSPSRAIKKKTPMEMWSGHPSDYGMLRIFGCVAYPYDKQGRLEPRAIKWVLLAYPEGVKGYRLYRLDGESPKIVTTRNVVFNESVMYKDTLKDSGAGDKSVEELQVEVELQRLNNHTPEEDQKDQEDGNDEDAEDQEADQSPDLTDYHNMATYAFAAAEEEDTHEPLTYQEAVACEDSSKWKAAMEEEMDSLRKNKTWELVDPPAGQKLVSSKWLFKIKEGIEGVQKPRYKARLVARGFTQRAGIDYNEVFSPVVRHTSIRVILALTVCKDYELEQLDVKTTFLHGNIEEVIYMKQPPGSEQDDMLIACKSKAEIGSTKSLLKKKFDMKELGEAKKIFGMEIVKDQSRKIMRVSQSGYVSKILNNFRIDNGKSVQMPLGGHFKLSLKDCPVRDCDVERMSLVYGTDRCNLFGLTDFVDSYYAKDPDKVIGAWSSNTMAVNWVIIMGIHLFTESVYQERTSTTSMCQFTSSERTWKAKKKRKVLKVGAWREFCEGMAAAGSFDEMIEVHEAYLLSIQLQCFFVPDKLVKPDKHLLLCTGLGNSVQPTLCSDGTVSANNARCQCVRQDHGLHELINMSANTKRYRISCNDLTVLRLIAARRLYHLSTRKEKISNADEKILFDSGVTHAPSASGFNYVALIELQFKAYHGCIPVGLKSYWKSDLKYSSVMKSFVKFAEEIFRGLLESLGRVENITFGGHFSEEQGSVCATKDRDNKCLSLLSVCFEHQGDDGDEHTSQALLACDHGFRMFIPITPGIIPELKRTDIAGGTLKKRGRHTTPGDGVYYFIQTYGSFSGGIIIWETGRTVKKLRTDNGLEFCNREFEQLCIESGIARHLTVAGTPQQNGVAERMNRTLMDKVRCLLIQSGLPKTFWAEATCTAAYLINRSPSTAIEKKTPMEMWSGHPSDYGMLRIFGCVAYPHNKQGKLEPRAIKCVLLGYPEGVKGNRLYTLDGESPKIVTSRNMVFNESVMYKDTLKDSSAGDKSVEELQVEVELQRFNNHTPEEDQIDQEDGDDEDAGDHETDQTPDLTDY